MMSSGLLHQLKIYNSQPVLQNGVAGFERRGHLGGSQALVKDATQLHYRLCKFRRVWSLTHTGNKRSGYLSLILFDHSS